jgi:hypothetical protein
VLGVDAACAVPAPAVNNAVAAKAAPTPAMVDFFRLRFMVVLLFVGHGAVCAVLIDRSGELRRF